MSTTPIVDVGQFAPVALRKYAIINGGRVASITKAHGEQILRAMPGVEDVVDITDWVGQVAPQWWWDGARFWPPSDTPPVAA